MIYVDGGIYQPAWNSSDENRNVTKNMYGIQIWPANMEIWRWVCPKIWTHDKNPGSPSFDFDWWNGGENDDAKLVEFGIPHLWTRPYPFWVYEPWWGVEVDELFVVCYRLRKYSTERYRVYWSIGMVGIISLFCWSKHVSMMYHDIISIGKPWNPTETRRGNRGDHRAWEITLNVPFNGDFNG